MEVNFNGNTDYMSAGPGYAEKSSAGKKAAKVAAGAAAAAGLAVGAFYALKKGGLDVFEGISKQEGKNVFQKTFNAIKNGENWAKLWDHTKKSAVKIKDTVVEFAKEHLPKAKKAAEEVVEETVA